MGQLLRNIVALANDIVVAVMDIVRWIVQEVKDDTADNNKTS